MTGKHIATGGREVYGLVVVCLQTYNSRILGVEDRKVESISLALEVLVQEIGVQEFIACDLEGSFQKLEKLTVIS